MSQRADFFEVEVGLETTLKRPIINTRDEPHATPTEYRRLHVIIGDANMCEVATYLKVGTTSLVLEMIEDEGCTEDLLGRPAVAALHAVSHDPTLTHHPAAARRAHADRRPAAVGVPRAGAPTSTTGTAATPTRTRRDVLARWESSWPGWSGPGGLRAGAGLGGEAALLRGLPGP